MGNRQRVLSLLSQFRETKTATPSEDVRPAPIKTQQEPFVYDPPAHDVVNEPTTPPPNPSRRSLAFESAGGDSPTSRSRRDRDRAMSTSSRPLSMIQTYQPPLMDVSEDTLPELQPIFTYLNIHGNKLYQEGYFLKLDDQNIHGRPNADRTWTECFAQLVGTVLSLWDAAELDAAGSDGEVLPKFINLTDCSIKMIEALPTRSNHQQPLQNVLSISTAGKNRYLFHFNSHHSLIQWTAAVRLAIYEHTTLQENYTGALIAGKGRSLNNISVIMERAKIPYADWARVRFGAGTPWRRCWCVVAPPDEKEYQKYQKQLKKRSAYDRSKPPSLKGTISFYDSKKIKKTRPIATITDAYSAFAIYPQSKPLIDASTLVKVEGSITIHSHPPTHQEGFVFVMPEIPPAVSGFEMMLRWLFPVLDTFNLYGRPGRLLTDTIDPKGLMFAMPSQRQSDYLENLDVSTLVLEPGSARWSESEWRSKMRDLTSKRMNTIEAGSRTSRRFSHQRSSNSFAGPRSHVQFDDAASTRSTPAISHSQVMERAVAQIPRVDSAPSTSAGFTTAHHRAASEAQGLVDLRLASPAPVYDGAQDAPTPPPHTVPLPASPLRTERPEDDMDASATSLNQQDSDGGTPNRELPALETTASPEPVNPPPAFSHSPGTIPAKRPYHSPELRRANSRMSTVTLSQLHAAAAAAGAGTGASPSTATEEGLGITEGEHTMADAEVLKAQQGAQ